MIFHFSMWFFAIFLFFSSYDEFSCCRLALAWPATSRRKMSENFALVNVKSIWVRARRRLSLHQPSVVIVSSKEANFISWKTLVELEIGHHVLLRHSYTKLNFFSFHKKSFYRRSEPGRLEKKHIKKVSHVNLWSVLSFLLEIFRNQRKKFQPFFRLQIQLSIKNRIFPFLTWLGSLAAPFSTSPHYTATTRPKNGEERWKSTNVMSNMSKK